MADMVLMPQMGVSEESAILAKWLVKEGDTVKNGTPLFSLETGKSAFECLAEKDGTIIKIFIPEGEEVTIGTPVCAIGEAGKSVDAPGAIVADVASAEAENEAVKEFVEIEKSACEKNETSSCCAASADGVVKASPRAKKLAERAGIDYANAVPSGPEGRIIERDVRELIKNGAPVKTKEQIVEAAASAAASAVSKEAEFEDKALSSIRKTIAKNMHKSLSEMAQLTLNSTFDATEISDYRAKCKKSKNPAFAALTINDFILYAVAKTLGDFPDLNAHYLDTKMRYFKNVHLGVAVDTPRGLMVPVIRNADTLSLCELSAEVKRLSAACREGSITPAELTGSTFTVSNLGASGIESFTPVINPPQTGILGVNTIMLRPRETQNGDVEFYKAMGLSLTFDHRALDGAPSAAFLKALGGMLENFALTLAV